MKGVIIVNAYYDAAEYLYQPDRLQKEFALLGVKVDIIKNNCALFSITNGNLVSALNGYDFCIYYDKDKYLLSAIESLKIPTFNRMQAIENCDDKMLTYMKIADNNVKIPDTISGLLCYDNNATISKQTLCDIEKLGYPIIVKESYGSRGKGVYIANDRKGLLDICQKVKCKPHLFQKCVTTSYGKDVRVIVVGGRVLGGMLRQSNGDFRSNLAVGGNASIYELDENTKALCLKIADILNLDYCGIDLLFDGNGGFYVCEVNSNAFFNGFEKATGINVAKTYAEYILNKING